jgi:CRP/FNR family cyclic AMP-dependent transcriptional regulator
MTETSIFDALRGSKLAVELDDEQCRTLAGVMSTRELAEGEVLVREGASDNHLYVVAEGVLGAIKHAGSPEAVTLAALTAGDVAGELAFLDGMERYASLVALGRARVLGLEREKLESLLDAHPRLVYRVMRAIVRVVHALQRRLSLQAAELSNYVYKQHGRY